MRPAGLLRVATLALIWGSAFLWIKLSLRGFSPVQLTWTRLTLGAAVLVAVLALSARTLPRQAQLWKRLALAALLGNAIPYLLFGIAEQRISSSLAGAINATTPLWTLAIALAVRAQPALGALRLIGLLLGFLGTLVILAPWEDPGHAHLTGALLCLAASASYGASYVYVGRFLTNTGLPPVVLSAGQLTAAAGWLTLSLPAGGLTAPTWRADAVTALLVLGALGTGAAYVLNYRIIADDGALLASTVTYLLPVVAVLLGALVLNEPLTLRMLAGVFVVLTGVALTRRHAPKHVPPPPVGPRSDQPS
ncbi:MAG TPA: DMT family transporter [Kineosporiaceae bacterium]|nr:DMT family transporter [Kineosporiaceae bacterium]